MQDNLRQATVCFLRQDNQLLLAHIEYAPDDRKWAGIGGFAEAGETLEDALLREVEEETFMHFVKDRLQKVGEFHREFVLNIFLTDTFTGEVRAKDPTIFDLMWFPIHDLPYPFMHPGTRDWMELILEGKYVKVIHGKVSEVAGF